ncbi:MAG: transposase [Deltaproteobacteria bacterium]|nr:transposase [Deltaproteobacteria bacterium]MBW2394992.1 transposase [Deltaproteobacteria bacterium]
MGSLCEAFDPAEARRLAERLEIHYTPKHGSWLNIAETELSVLAMQCLDRRIPPKQDLEREVEAWEYDRNNTTKGVDWQSTTEDARVKLRRLYPQIVS